MSNNLKKGLLALKIVVILFPVVLLLKAGTTISGKRIRSTRAVIDTPLTNAQKRLTENALKGLAVAPGLKVQMMASEPMIINPTNIDVDERGRIWVLEAYNYRFVINSNKPNTDGDRIMILEDKDGDGKAETSKVFYQGPEINAPLGIAVLGNRVLVSQSPYVWAFYDDNGDDKADRKEILFQGVGGEQHDHGMHTFTFGPDGKLYFNFGNSGITLKDKNNNVVLDQDGDEIGPGKYQEGMVFRSDPDGSNVECLGSNFRNPYEPAVDSYGTIWQSDNDDDGNKGVRINYVMEYGNFGFKDEITKAAWRTDRVGVEKEIPLQHWHLNDPGIVPNLLQTGAGSPTGILVYEGSALPQQFQNQMIHTDAGVNVVRAYPVKKSGAGYTAEMVNVLNGPNDQWFRPADVAVAPDGSLIVADWYDPGVGGHRVGDLQRGRIYRVAASNSASYKAPVQNYSTAAGAVIALQNPNLAVRRHAYVALQGMGAQAIPVLEKLWTSSPNPRMKARALWLLSKSTNGTKYIDQAIKNSNPDLRIVGLRAARQLKNVNTINYVKQLVNDPDPQVRRECAIALRHSKAPEAADLWATLASKNDGTDRWYLEALGIGADRQWDTFLAAYMNKVKEPLATAGGKDILWRARTTNALPYLAQLASDGRIPMEPRLRYFRAFDFLPGPEKTKALLQVLQDNNNRDLELNATVLKVLSASDAGSPLVTNAIRNVLPSLTNTQEYLALVKKYNVTTEGPKLIGIVTSKGSDPLAVEAARLLFAAKDGQRLAPKPSLQVLSIEIKNVFGALGMVGNAESMEILTGVALSDTYSGAIRGEAVRMLGKSRAGETRVLDMLRARKMPANLIPSAVEGLSGTRTKAIYDEAKTFLPNAAASQPAKKASTVNFNEILAMSSDAMRGAAVFDKTCIICHQANGKGFDFGPGLSEIGSKLPKESILDAIVNPAAGVSFGYETSQIEMKDGSSLLGIISSRTETDTEIKYPGGSTQKIKTADAKTISKLPGSMMPEGLHETMTKQELADLVQYLSMLKKK